jgi:hypothetical protein
MIGSECRPAAGLSKAAVDKWFEISADVLRSTTNLLKSGEQGAAV